MVDFSGTTQTLVNAIPAVVAGGALRRAARLSRGPARRRRVVIVARKRIVAPKRRRLVSRGKISKVTRRTKSSRKRRR